MTLLVGSQNTGWTTSAVTPAGTGGSAFWRNTSYTPVATGTANLAYVHIHSWGTATTAKVLVYRASDGVLLAQSADIASSGGTGLRSASISAAIDAAVPVRLAVLCNTGFLTVLNNTAAADSTRWDPMTFATPDDPLPAGTFAGTPDEFEIYLTGTTGSNPTISSVTPTTFANGQTGIVIGGTGFGATQGSGQVRIGTSSSNPATGAVTQTVTAWSDTSITITAARGALATLTDLYLFVTNNGGTSNATGFTVQFQPRVRITDRLIDSNGSALASLTGITASIWRNGEGPTSAAPGPDQVIEGVTIDASGNLNVQITRGSLVSPNPVFVMLDRQGSPNRAFAGVVVPTYD